MNEQASQYSTSRSDINRLWLNSVWSTRSCPIPSGHASGWNRARYYGLHHDAVEAFIKQDVEEAEEIIRRDDEVDALFNQVKTDVVELLKSSPSHADQGIDLLMIAKYLERIGDHAVNVCEWTQFCKTGALKNVRIM